MSIIIDVGSNLEGLFDGLVASLPQEGDPCNLEGTYYSGKNVAILLLSAEANGYPSNRWGTYLQCKAHGLQVRKGEKGTGIAFHKYEEGERVFRSFKVFNVAQCDVIEADEVQA